MEAEGLLLCLQELTTVPYPESNVSSSHLTLFP